MLNSGYADCTCGANPLALRWDSEYAMKDWLDRYDALTPAADAPIAHSRSQAKRLTAQTGIEHIAAADAAEGGKGSE